MTMSTVGKSIKTVLIDLSGTLHIDNSVINGSIDALKKLRESGVAVKFVTNTTKESRRFLHERLISLGFQLSANEIFTSLHAARDFIRQKSYKPMLLIDEAAWEDFEEFKGIKDEELNAVVVGLAPKEFCYEKLNQAFRLLLSGAPLVAIHQARYYKQADGLSLGPGPFVKALEFAADTRATVVGKPSGAFFQAALQGLDPTEAAMIGDDVRDDIGGAQQLGMRGLLVKTGKYREGDETKIEPAPHAVCQDFSAAVNLLLSSNSCPE